MSPKDGAPRGGSSLVMKKLKLSTRKRFGKGINKLICICELHGGVHYELVHR